MTSRHCFSYWSLTRLHSRKRPAPVTTTFFNSRGGRLRELRLFRKIVCVRSKGIKNQKRLIQSDDILAGMKRCMSLKAKAQENRTSLFSQSTVDAIIIVSDTSVTTTTSVTPQKIYNA